MRLRIAARSFVNRMLAHVGRVHWRDPLVQTWSLVGGLLIVCIGAHYGRRGVPGEKKNLQETTEWLQSGHPGIAEHWKPAVVFSPDAASAAESNTALELDLRDLRACANRAADQPAWRFLSADLRGTLATLPACTEAVTVAWSGTRGGDAAALDLYHTGTLGLTGGTPCDFVIGNGNRGRDGLVEVTRRWREGRNPENRVLAICLVGERTNERPTPAQEAALGELVAWIEARTGCLILTMQRPRDRGLLADTD